MMKLNKYLSIGLIITMFTVVINQLIALPHFIYGIGLGVGVAFEIVGLYAINYDISKFNNFKRNLFRKDQKVK